jgi:hypothetical protein
MVDGDSTFSTNIFASDVNGSTTSESPITNYVNAGATNLAAAKSNTATSNLTSTVSDTASTISDASTTT